VGEGGAIDTKRRRIQLMKS